MSDVILEKKTNMNFREQVIILLRNNLVNILHVTFIFHIHKETNVKTPLRTLTQKSQMTHCFRHKLLKFS